MDQEKLIEALLLLLKEAKFEDESNQEKANQLIELFELETEETEEFNDSEEEFESSELDEILGGYGGNVIPRGDIDFRKFLKGLTRAGIKVEDGSKHAKLVNPKTGATTSVPRTEINTNTAKSALKTLGLDKNLFFGKYY